MVHAIALDGDGRHPVPARAASSIGIASTRRRSLWCGAWAACGRATSIFRLRRFRARSLRRRVRTLLPTTQRRSQFRGRVRSAFDTVAQVNTATGAPAPAGRRWFHPVRHHGRSPRSNLMSIYSVAPFDGTVRSMGIGEAVRMEDSAPYARAARANRRGPGRTPLVGASGLHRGDRHPEPHHEHAPWAGSVDPSAARLMRRARSRVLCRSATYGPGGGVRRGAPRDRDRGGWRRLPPDPDRRLSVHDRAQLLVAVYSLLGESDASAGAARVRELIAIARRFGVADAVRESASC